MTEIEPATIRLPEPCAPRPIRFLELVQWDGWRIKLYGGAYRRRLPRDELVEATRKLIPRVLPQPAISDTRYGVGFACAHDGRGGCFAMVDWWADENELHHRIFRAPQDDAFALADVGPDGLTACVWDLAIMAFERQAWLDTVLRSPKAPDLESYLMRRLEGDL